MAHDPYTLPPDLPVPEDDGGADHLPGLGDPGRSCSTRRRGRSTSRELALERAVLYVYPRTGTPGVDRCSEGWDAYPGARGCTPQSCGFRDHAPSWRSFGARVAGLSAQTLAEQIEFAERNAHAVSR